MSQKQAMQYKVLASNGSGSTRRRSDKDISIRSDKISGHMRLGLDTTRNSSSFHASGENTRADVRRPVWEGMFSGDRESHTEKDLQDRLIYLTTRLIGQPVEVQLKNGSVYTGILHTVNFKEEHGVVLKMARLIKDASHGGGKDHSKVHLQKASLKTVVIVGRELVQVIAKNVPINEDTIKSGRTREHRHEILTDSALAKGHYIELQRELKPWTPDSDAPEDLDLENTFQNTRNRHWDQFETNRSLFGVESTFDEELYTTKLEKGPQTRDLELKASRIAKEIEEEASSNFHLAEPKERGICFANGSDPYDEESRFSSVLRVEDIGEDNEDICIDNRNDETFGPVLRCGRDSSFEIETEKKCTDQSTSSMVNACSYLEKSQGSCDTTSKANADSHRTSKEAISDTQLLDINTINKDMRELSLDENESTNIYLEKCSPCPANMAENQIECSKGSSSPDLAGITSTKNEAESQEPTAAAASNTTAASGQTSSVTVVANKPLPDSGKVPSASKKSTLNPNAKEFKLNPNAKSFTPSGIARPGSSAAQGSVYVPGSTPSVTPIQNLQVGVGLNSLVQPGSQSAKFTQYNNVITAAGATASSFVQPVAPFLPRVTSVQSLVPAQSSVKISHPGQQVVGNSFVTQSSIRYASQASAFNQAPAYLNPSNQLYSQQQMVLGQPGPLLYVQHYPNEIMPSPHIGATQGPVTALATTNPAQQPKRGPTMPGMQYVVAAPFVAGQQPGIQSPPIHMANTLQTSRGVLVPASHSSIQNPHTVVSGTGPNGGSVNANNGVWVGGKASSANFQQ